MSSPWILTHCTQHRPPVALDPTYAEPDAESLIDEYLADLSAEDRIRFREETDAVSDVLMAALHAYLEAHPENMGPWMWANATGQLAYSYARNLEEFITDLDADDAAEDCDA